jgi:hypothetical protein
MTPRTVIIACFTGLAVLMIGTELVARRRGSTLSPLGATLTAALRSTGGRISVLAVWLWLGWHFLAR